MTHTATKGFYSRKTEIESYLSQRNQQIYVTQRSKQHALSHL